MEPVGRHTPSRKTAELFNSDNPIFAKISNTFFICYCKSVSIFLAGLFLQMSAHPLSMFFLYLDQSIELTNADDSAIHASYLTSL
ncbi:hypothetical protein DAI22_05g105601 [Oryza sativa Japonica Group]|nr:hypothetical protein DAI22_05g105601 [Oryza sativa Japonica Group]